MRQRTLGEILDYALQSIKPITQESKERIVSYAQRYRSDMRIATGRIYTDKEFEERRKKILSTPLP